MFVSAVGKVVVYVTQHHMVFYFEKRYEMCSFGDCILTVNDCMSIEYYSGEFHSFNDNSCTESCMPPDRATSSNSVHITNANP